MKERVPPYRIIGATILFVACACGLMLRRASPAAAGQTDPRAENLLILVALVISCFGIALLLKRPSVRKRRSTSRNRTTPRKVDAATPPIDDPVLPWDPGLGGGRMALTAHLILRGQQHASLARGRDARSSHVHAVNDPELHTERH